MSGMAPTCENCRNAALRGMALPLRKVGEADGPTFIYRCDSCGTFWEENLREAHPISQKEAEALCPALKANRQ